MSKMIDAHATLVATFAVLLLAGLGVGLWTSAPPAYGLACISLIGLAWGLYAWPGSRWAERRRAKPFVALLDDFRTADRMNCAMTPAASMTSHFQEAEKAGLIRAVKFTDDGRPWAYKITDAGRDAPV